MAKHKLTTEQADTVNSLSGFARERGDDPEAATGAAEGDSVDSFVAANGDKVVLVLASDGTVHGVSVDDESDDSQDETPVSA